MHSDSTLCKPCLVWYSWMIIAFVFFKTRGTKKKGRSEMGPFFNSKYFYNKRSLNIFFLQVANYGPWNTAQDLFSRERKKEKKIIISFIICTPIKYESSTLSFSPSQLQPDRAKGVILVQWAKKPFLPAHPS